MKKLAYGIVLAMLLLWILPGQAFAAGMLVPGGQLVGLELQDGSVTVAGFDENYAEKLEKAGLAVGDRLPEGGDAWLEGDVGYHLRKGAHFFSRADWHQLIRFVRQHYGANPEA